MADLHTLPGPVLPEGWEDLGWGAVRLIDMPDERLVVLEVAHIGDDRWHTTIRKRPKRSKSAGDHGSKLAAIAAVEIAYCLSVIRKEQA